MFSLVASMAVLIWTSKDFTTGKLVSPQLLSSNSIGLNQWFPKSVLGASIEEPKITADSAIFIETKVKMPKLKLKFPLLMWR